MKYRSPYFVKHIFLQEILPDISSFSDKESGHYLVFWWQQIPLGDLYIENGLPLSNRDFREKVLNTISPTIDHYIRKPGMVENYQAAFIKNDLLIFNSIMAEILSDFLPAGFPKQVGISVIICTRNRTNYLKACMETLFNQVSAPQEILIIDNAPADDSTEKTVQQFAQITYYREMRAGLDIARNTGAKLARHPVIAYIDDDVELHPLWAYQVWNTFRTDRVDAMTGLILPTSLHTESQQIFEKHWGFNKGYRHVEYDPGFIRTTVPRVWDIGAGVNMAFRKSLLEKVNYFDERLDVGAAGCNGDSEIWFRILSAGYTIKYNPVAVAYHKHREDFSSLHKQIFSYMRGHTAAALFQHAQNRKAGYKKYIFLDITKYYLMLIRVGFPSYSFRYRTLWTEIKGIFSGIRFFYKNRNSPRILPTDQPVSSR